MTTDTQNTIFQQALAFVNHTNQHLFLTGKAGTGKTTFLKYVRENCPKKMAVLAPTGVAAINAGGVTIHSFFQLPFGTYVPSARTVWGGEFLQVYNKNQLLGKLRFQKSKRELIQELELLIIDEVSMVRADVMDAIDTVLRSVRRKPHVPFGGVQLLLIGDLFQLPPVVKDIEREFLAEFYQSPFFFDALSIKEAEPIYIELNKIYRQQDENFIRLLNRVRNNECDYDDLEQLHQHYKPYFTPYPEEKYITLTTHNYQADAINQQELEKLPNGLHRLDAIISKDFPENAYPVEKSLYLKVGAQIMFIKNEKGEKRRYFNGKIATISRIEEGDIWIRFDTASEDELKLELETWRNIRYQYDRESDEVKEQELGTFQHYPIRLAWAVTIHKSQGLTFDKAIINAGKAFAAGQVYVALSRLTNLHGLVLMSKIRPEAIMTDSRVVDYAETKLGEEQLQETLERSQLIYAEQSLLTAFDFGKLVQQFQAHLETYEGRAVADLVPAERWAKNCVEQLLEQQIIAEKYIDFIQKKLQLGNKGYAAINDRMPAASSWFSVALNQLITATKEHINEWKPKPRTKKYITELGALMLSLARKKVQVQQAPVIAAGLHQSGELAGIMQAVNRLQHPEVAAATTAAVASSKPAVGASKKISLELFQSGKTIDEIVQIRSMAHSTIEGHLASFLPSGAIKITDLMDEATFLLIQETIKKQSSPTLSSLKSALGDAASYGAIRAVLSLQPKNSGNKE